VRLADPIHSGFHAIQFRPTIDFETRIKRQVAFRRSSARRRSPGVIAE
jgi:hypothetical protein